MSTTRKRVIIWFCLTVGTYALSAFVLLDWGKPAYASDEEIFNGKEVAFGPKPRSWVCRPSWEGVRFDGSEWPLAVYRPVCWIWRTMKGFETPARWR